MNLYLNTSIASQYRSKSQQARVITEDWVKNNMFCPMCGNMRLSQFTANRPVADFYCEYCVSEYELKSKEIKRGELPQKINDGAYYTMISRITSMNNPHLFILFHDLSAVSNFFIIPKYFFTPAIIEKRKPLSETARRAGWTGCNIIINNIPNPGKIFIINNSIIRKNDTVVSECNKTQCLETKNIENRGWLLDVLSCIDRIESEEFSLAQVYAFEIELKRKHPENNFVRDKIRQQLQLLRDKGFIEFMGRGNYKK